MWSPKDHELLWLNFLLQFGLFNLQEDMFLKKILCQMVMHGNEGEKLSGGC